MIVGCPKEIKNHEYRVGLTPSMVKSLAANNHTVLIEKKAGLGSGFSDDLYERAGARIVTATEVYNRSELIVKVKEPQPTERRKLREDQLLFTYLHLAADKTQTVDFY